MELSTVRTLAELNRRFYEEHAENFADSRPRLAPGARRIVDRIPASARVLEVGCGDGKVGRALAGMDYVGVDQSTRLLERAQAYTLAHRPEWTGGFQEADLLAEDLGQHLPPGPFDWVLALAVLHHLPGAANRQRVVGHLAARLALGGHLVMSNWQFQRSARLLGRQAPWTAVGLHDEDVEPGDALLTWERKGRHGLRFVHALGEAEAKALLDGAGLRVVETFAADGVSGDLALYVVARREVR